MILVKSAMIQEIIFFVHESSEDGYEAEALNESIYTEADTLEELRQMIKDAVQCHFQPGDQPDTVRFMPCR